MILIEESQFDFIQLKKKESIMIASCFRCFGGLILFDRKKDLVDTNFAEQGVMVWHMLPSPRRTVLVEDVKEVIIIIEKHLPYYEAKSMYRCGGNIDTEENRGLYKLMKEEIENPIKNLFTSIPVLGVEPNVNTFFSNILLNEDRKVFANAYGGKNKYIEMED
jgi:hypothetical protein